VDAMGANKVVQKSKEAKMKAAMAGDKSKKKKWSKGKVNDEQSEVSACHPAAGHGRATLRSKSASGQTYGR